MLQANVLRYIRPLPNQFASLQSAYSSRSHSDEEADYEAARQWFAKFHSKDQNPSPMSKSTGMTEQQSNMLSLKQARTRFVRPGGPGGQKTNKTSTKADTEWSMKDLETVVPKILYQGLRASSYYVASSDSIRIKCDEQRSQTQNKLTCYQRLAHEIEKIYKTNVPGVTTAVKQERVVALQKAENLNRLKFKKMHGDKKRSRKGGGPV
ncbi:hypothetical protein GLAREA_11630 [Glarea lozoyensis ATCC 20868]|uniref:Prokaryotic-type class I peptide chain release factors domain-containing protein n=1 Tax=Glarea lozoyensis (strain ATCC 20868 / MF5171) TaxID=1116229 RepID=S3CIF9_GLAL2|nr:uncharacterized protein GLAREA_11630 [Glarea lozoyensis ATCC 20868]EPE25049.1 hypothetical protein GLAREA_11630 [Glarea lozoyensis ATCC 20868]